MLTTTRPTRKVAPPLTVAVVAVLVVGGVNLFHTFGPIHEHNDGPLNLGAAGLGFCAE